MTPQRIKDRDAIEHRLLDLAYTTDAKITTASLAYFAPCSFADAEALLDDLTARERIRMEIEDDGTIAYTLPHRGERFPRVEPAAHHVPSDAIHEPPHTGLVRAVPGAVVLPALQGASPTLAALLSMVMPGAGHLYTGRWLSAVMWFVLVGLGYWLVLPGLVLHFFCIMSAAASARRLSSALERRQLIAATS